MCAQILYEVFMYISSEKYTADILSIQWRKHWIAIFPLETSWSSLTGYSMAVVEHWQPVTKDIIENKTWIQWYVFEKGNSNGPLNRGKEGKTMFYLIKCRFSKFLVQLCIKNAFLWARAEILLLCAEKLHFLGSVQKYYYPGTRGGWILVQGHFWGMCRYIHFWRNIHLCSPVHWI